MIIRLPILLSFSDNHAAYCASLTSTCNHVLVFHFPGVDAFELVYSSC